MRSKTILLVAILFVVHVAILLAGFFAPYDPASQNRELPYAPPTKIHFRNRSGLHFRPFVYALKPELDGYSEDEHRAFPIQLLVRGQSYSLLGILETDWHLFGVAEPGKICVLGTDGFGRDELSRVLFGGQISVATGIVATLVALLVGTFTGMFAGYFGGWADELLMGAGELFLSLPWLYFLLGVRAFLPLHVSPGGTFLLLTCTIGLIGWARPGRLVRGMVASVRSENHVLAARGFGAGDFYLLRRHIFPEVSGLLLTQATVLVPRYIAAEVALSFLGLGVNEPTPSWGNMLSTLQQYSVLVSYGWLLAPAFALVITSVIYSLLADYLHSQLKFQSS